MQRGQIVFWMERFTKCTRNDHPMSCAMPNVTMTMYKRKPVQYRQSGAGARTIDMWNNRATSAYDDTAARTNAPCLASVSCNCGTGRFRGVTPAPAAREAATPAAWPVIQHCGISRRNEWLVASHDTARPATSSPSNWSGTSAPYGTDTSGYFGDSEGDIPISSGRATPEGQSSRVTRSTPTSRRAWRTPVCGADSIRNAASNPGA